MYGETHADRIISGIVSGWGEEGTPPVRRHDTPLDYFLAAIAYGFYAICAIGLIEQVIR